jgi:ribonuclease Z
VLLFDCGEGTQFQLHRAGIKSPRIEAIFITHLHGDHYFGLLGLISSFAMLGKTSPLTLVGPAGIRSITCAMPDFNADRLPFELTYKELHEGFDHEIVFRGEGFHVEARPIEHRIQAAGYRFQERSRPGKLDPDRARALGVTDVKHFAKLKHGVAVNLGDGRVVHPEQVVGPERPGKSFAYVTDTRPCDGGIELARNVDLLYHEATFASEMYERAVETGHSTAIEAATVAREAGARRLLLGHLSARYTDPWVLIEEARSIFQNTAVAEELKRYPI